MPLYHSSWMWISRWSSLSSLSRNICTLHRQRYVSSFPELSIVQFFECLQYSKRGREGLVNFITWTMWGIGRRGGGGGTLGSKEHILIGLHCTVSAVGNDLYRQFTRPFPLLQKWVWLARPIQNLPDLSLIIRIPYLKCCPFGLLSFTWTDNHSEVARYTGL